MNNSGHMIPDLKGRKDTFPSGHEAGDLQAARGKKVFMQGTKKLVYTPADGFEQSTIALSLHDLSTRMLSPTALPILVVAHF